MSSLVVTGGRTYESVKATNVDSLIVETDNDPELDPEIAGMLRYASDRGYRPDDRNDILRSVISKSPPLDITNSIPRMNKYQMKEDQLNDDPDDTDSGDVDGGFEDGDLLFKFEGGGEGIEEFEGGSVGEYFSW